MSACSLCCLFHRLVPCAVFLRCVDFWSCFVIGVIGLFLHVDCFFLFNFSSFFALCSCFNSFLIDLLLFCAVSFFLESLVVFLYLVRGCGGLLCHWCITTLHPHKARKFPCTGSQSSPAALGEAFWTYHISYLFS